MDNLVQKFFEAANTPLTKEYIKNFFFEERNAYHIDVGPDEFICWGWSDGEDDEQVLVALGSDKYFKTKDAFAEYLYNYITDVNEEDIHTVEEFEKWVLYNVLDELSPSGADMWVIYTRSFTA